MNYGYFKQVNVIPMTKLTTSMDIAGTGVNKNK